MIKGISHITLIVSSLQQTSHFLQTVFDAELVYSSGEKTFSLAEEMFFLVGGVWLCIMRGEPPSERSYNHIAFQIADADFESYRAKVVASGAQLCSDRVRVAGEGRSMYFYDFDNHLFELHTGTLETRLHRYTLPKHLD